MVEFPEQILMLIDALDNQMMEDMDRQRHIQHKSVLIQQRRVTTSPCLQCFYVFENQRNSMAQSDRKYLLVLGYCRMESKSMHIIDGIISIIFDYQKHAKWSSQYKGDSILLLEDNSN